MIIKTKYSVDDTVYFIHENKIQMGEVLQIDVILNGYPVWIWIRYQIKGMERFWIEERGVFATKEDLIASL